MNEDCIALIPSFAPPPLHTSPPLGANIEDVTVSFHIVASHCIALLIKQCLSAVKDLNADIFNGDCIVMQCNIALIPSSALPPVSTNTLLG